LRHNGSQVIAGGITKTSIIATRRVYESENGYIGDILETRELTHLHQVWPTDSSPSQDDVDALITQMRTLSLNPTNPIAIHCRKGFGRSGTLAAMDALSYSIDQQIAAGANVANVAISVENTVYMDRQQRRGAVDSDAQLMGCFDLAARRWTQLSAPRA
jgi:protein tyrosine phosphatase